MSEFKIAGCCTLCDTPCYDVLATWGADERYPGEPKRLGQPGDGSRITFMLLDGSKADLTFCSSCAESLNPSLYIPIWHKVLRSWKREMGPDKVEPDWFLKSYENGLLAEMGRKTLKELVE